MDNPSPDHGLSLTLSWSAPDGPRRRSIPLGALLRVALGVALCAACYEAGRWHGGLEAQIDRPSGRVAAEVRTVKALAVSAMRGEGVDAAPGNAVGEPQDLITPLNVRDPSALVMPPTGAGPAANQPPSDVPPTPPARVFPRPSAEIKPDPRF
jgi:hypothetical protein